MNRQAINKKYRLYYKNNPDYRERKKQKMREYSMNFRIRNGTFGSIVNIIKVLRGV